MRRVALVSQIKAELDAERAALDDLGASPPRGAASALDDGESARARRLSRGARAGRSITGLNAARGPSAAAAPRTPGTWVPGSRAGTPRAPSDGSVTYREPPRGMLSAVTPSPAVRRLPVLLTAEETVAIARAAAAAGRALPGAGGGPRHAPGSGAKRRAESFSSEAGGCVQRTRVCISRMGRHSRVHFPYGPPFGACNPVYQRGAGQVSGPVRRDARADRGGAAAGPAALQRRDGRDWRGAQRDARAHARRGHLPRAAASGAAAAGGGEEGRRGRRRGRRRRGTKRVKGVGGLGRRPWRFRARARAGCAAPRAARAVWSS